jgi:outer membrane protein OmpA-like peptidoglycan-associated protein/opacity protein-like surface antigen
MHKWYTVLAMSTIMAIPLAAQQTEGAANPVASETRQIAAANGAAERLNLASAPHDAFAAPASPRPTPFAAPAAKPVPDSTTVGRLLPRYEIAGMYSYINFNSGDPFDRFSNHGATGSFTYNASNWLGLTGEIGEYHYNRNIATLLGGTPPNAQTSGGITTYLFGPRLNLRRFDYFVPFGEFLVGGAHGDSHLTGDKNQSSFAMAIGGGVDVALTRNIAWRFAQIDYLLTNFSGPTLGEMSRQNNMRLGTGIVVRWGFPAPPPPPNHSPVAACSANPVSVYQSSGDPAAIHVDASDADNDPLTYGYAATGGTVEGTGPDARWNSSGLAVGTYTVTAKVDDGKGGTASCAADIKVEERPHHPPSITCAPDRSPILPGEHATIQSTASSPDNLKLTYSYSSTGGHIAGEGPAATFDGTGLAPGSYQVDCGVTDERGDKSEGATQVEVKEPPQIKQLEAKLALHSIYFPTAQPTVAKPDGGLVASQAGTLDTLAADFQQYLAYRPDAHLMLEGHADIRGTPSYNQALSERRVARTKNYLIEKGVPADHIETKAYGVQRNMTSEEVKSLLEQDTELTPAEKQKLLKNLLTVRLANNRRVDVTLSTTGEQSVRRFPFNSKDALTLISRQGGETKKAKKPATKKAAKP